MVAVPSPQVPTPATVVAIPSTATLVATGRHRRAVAVAVTAMELLRPESDLARLLESFTEVDVLLAADDVVSGSGSVCSIDPAVGDIDGDDLPDQADDVPARVAQLGLPGVELHRLGLVAPQVAGAETDLVAAMSELVGFDPEPGVYCLAPAVAPGDPNRAAVGRAAQRIAQVYGIPLLRYRCLELALVEPV